MCCLCLHSFGCAHCYCYAPLCCAHNGSFELISAQVARGVILK
ncbi:hypothetical protein PRUB_b1209 [Pseudoalteromonas rubra]|uniref:Uncharacterized protein n=1 Tax=Pseudoalteromonas rubra TaxID=43658 RepID=A0A8T0C1S8_9GAMM|nr:hypothetical protein PRUB_b1209 [Pseudoalteromonas rubra]